MLAAVLKTARPHQWVKNLFAAAPLVFALKMREQEAVLRTAAAVACFCVVSSAVYLLNDIVDVEKDRAHPTKRRRPIASGALPVGVARKLWVIFALAGLAGGAVLAPSLFVVLLAYLLLNLAYSFRLKKIPFVDVLLIAFGFLLRVLGGAFAIAVPPSEWLLICTLLLSCFLGFGKRAHELRLAEDDAKARREVLERYDLRVLSILIVSLGVATAGTYAAYTRSEHARGLFEGRPLGITIPFVVFALGRFLWITLKEHDQDSPTDSMLRDAPFLLSLLGWAAGILYVIYGPR